MSKYLFGKGKVGLFERDPITGIVGKGLYLGNCPSLKISLNVETKDHYESQSGKNGLDRQIVTQSGLEFEIEVEDIKKENRAILLNGDAQDLAALTAQVYTFPTVLVNETRIVPSGFGLSATTMRDSAVTPAIVPTTKYDLDANFGTVKFTNITGYTQPFKLTYDRSTGENVPFLAGDRPVRFLRFEGINIGNPGDPNKYELIEIYNAVFNPAQDINLIGDDFAKFAMKGAGQVDDTRAADAAFGQFGRWISVTND